MYSARRKAARHRGLIGWPKGPEGPNTFGPYSCVILHMKEYTNEYFANWRRWS